MFLLAESHIPGRETSVDDRIRAYSLSKQDKETLLERLSKALESRSEILFAYAHGSFLEDCPFRDFDIAVYLDSADLPQSRFHYEDRLTRELVTELDLSFPLDLKLLNETPLPFQYNVFRGRLLMDRDPEVRLERLTHAVARYLDIKPILEHHAREAFGNGHRL
jgi:hypothetical protein